MAARSLIARLRKSVARQGLRGTVRSIGLRLYRIPFPVRMRTHPFDLKYGVDTSGLLDSSKLPSGHANDLYSTAYWGTSPSLFQGALNQWQQTLAGTPWAVEDYAFLDIGCGKGRVVMLATNTPFRRVIGVELSPVLTSIAHANLALWNKTPHACSDVTVLNADALTLPFPDSPGLIYLFNPFDQHVMQPLLERLAALSQTRSTPVDIIYTRPEQAAVFQQIPQIELLWSGNVPLAREDTAADAFYTREQDTHIYRLVGTLSHPAPALSHQEQRI